MGVRALSAFIVVAVVAAPLGAQVGYPPAESPFRDLEFRQEATLFTGYFTAGADPVGIAPRSGPVFGARYEVRIGGPAQFTGRVARVWSQRTVIDPEQPAETREIGERDLGLYIVDAGLSFNLTGQKSWHGFVPLVTAGIGIATDFQISRDVGGYRMGTPFALSAGGGLRWVPQGPYQARLDAVTSWYQIRYPESYFSGSIDPVRTGSQSVWTRNIAITIGASYQFFR
jgi:hypothetical protein